MVTWLCGVYLQFPTAYLAKTSENDFQPKVSSTPEFCASKQTVQVKELHSLEQSLQAVTISERKTPSVSSTDTQLLIAQKKGLQSEISSETKEIEKLQVILIVIIIIIVTEILDILYKAHGSEHGEVFLNHPFCSLKIYAFTYIYML
jgi:hypothetical protein